MVSIEELLAIEATEYELKEALEIKKPKSWLKTISAFANSAGGLMLFGVNDKTRAVTGINNPQKEAEIISERIKTHIAPLPVFNLKAYRIENRSVLALQVEAGETTPYFYQGDGSVIAYIRIGNESVPADANRLRELALKGKNLSFDSMPTEYKLDDMTFAIFEATFKKDKKQIITHKDYVSFGLCKPDGTLTYVGLLFSDECPLLQSRVFCTRWNGLTKGSGGDDAIDDKEFEGDLISQLIKSHDFVKMNSKVRWKKMSNHRVDKPDYADRAVFEALANALMHRDYTQTTLKQSDKAESKSSKQGRTLRSRFFNQDQKGSISLSSGL